MAIQDTTELNYTSHKALSGTGYLDNKYAKGLKVHSVLTLSTQGIPLGIIEQQVWSRTEEELGKAEQRKQKPTAEKESNRWLDALKKTDSMIPDAVQIVTIADREADFYDLFACPRRPGSDFLIRATQNRCVVESGCGVEKLQLETSQRLEMALATYSIVAWRLLWLTYLARCTPNTSCESVLETHEWQILYATIHHQLYPHTSPPTLAEVVDWIARLGGFLGRKGDAFPGVKVLWRGWSRLHDLVQGWLISQSVLVN